MLISRKLGAELPKDLWPIAWATVWGGVLILIIEWSVTERRRRTEVTWGIAIVVAVAQILAAVFPGTSRAGATILFAMAIGLTRAAATEFSFLLGIPTMFAASAYAIYKDLKAPSPEHTAWSMVALGTLVSAVVAFIVVRWLLRFIQSHTFVGFRVVPDCARAPDGVLRAQVAGRLRAKLRSYFFFRRSRAFWSFSA